MSLPASAGLSSSFALVAACVLLAAFLLACNGDDADSTSGERLLILEAEAHSLEEALETLHEENEAVLREVAALRNENAALKDELAALRQEKSGYSQTLQEANAAEESEYADAAVVAGQGEKLAALEEVQLGAALAIGDLDSRMQEMEATYSRVGQALADLDERVLELESAISEIESLLLLMNSTSREKELPEKTGEDTGIGRTLRLAAEGGGRAQVINYGAGYGGARSAVLVLPDPLPEGEIPLIVSLHGFGGDSFSQASYVPLHNRVNRDGFALLLPNGVENAEGIRFWNPTDGFGKADQDDVNALSALVQEAGGEFDMGPVYIFGYSNGGFMAYWMACKGLPGLRAIASLAGTSYYEDSECEGAPPVSVLHVHGMDDRVIRFHGSEESEFPALTPGEWYTGAKEMYYHWGARAGCDGNSQEDGEDLDLDTSINGAETFTFRFSGGCAEGITVEMWASDWGGHTPAYGDAFADALLDWLLAQQ